MPDIPAPCGLSPEAKDKIDSMTIQELLRKWRFAPPGAFQVGDAESEYFEAVMNAKKFEDPAAFTAASKSIGWG